MTTPTYSVGELVHFSPVRASFVACKVTSYDRGAQRYTLTVTARKHPTYRCGERIVTSANWVWSR